MHSGKLYIVAALLPTIFFFTSPLFAQKSSNLFFEKVEGEGLTNHYIKCIRQDGNGFLWFGTTEGVFQYDGYSFKAFRSIPGKEQTLINDDIENLYAEKDS